MIVSRTLTGRDAVEWVKANFAARHLTACDRCGHALVVHGSFSPGCSLCGSRVLCEVQITITEFKAPLLAAGGS
jgi:hypothetical protein